MALDLLVKDPVGSGGLALFPVFSPSRASQVAQRRELDDSLVEVDVVVTASAGSTTCS